MKSLKGIYIVVLCVLFSLGNIHGQSTESLMSQGNMLLSNGAYDQSVSVFRKVMARDPSNFEAQFNLAFAYLNWGRYSNAVTEFNKAVRLNPASAECWSNLAMAYQALGKDQKAIDALYRAVQQNPSNVTARINLATMYGQRKHTGQAIAQYKKVLQIDGTNLVATVNLAKCLSAQRKYKQARHYLKSAIAINPNDAEAYWELGNLLWHKDKDADGALTNYRKAIVLKPNNQTYYENLGLLLEDLWKKNKDDTKKTEAIDVWKKALVYLDDALKKEDIQMRLEMLERGESPSGKATPEELFGKTSLSKEDAVVRDEGKQGDDVQHIQTETYDVSGDLSGLGEEEEEGGGAFDFDMKKAVKKKKKETESKEEE